MDSHVTEDSLFAYHVGVSPDEERASIEEHLCACGACLRTFLDMKRHLDRGEGGSPRPSAETRARLRASVQAAFRPTAATRIRRALRRPIPLYQGLAAAAVALAIAGFYPFARGLVRADAPPPSPGEQVDTARLTPESLTIY